MRKIWLLLSIALLLPMAAQAGAKIKFDNAMHNFDVVSEDGGRVSHSFEFTNEGDAPLVVSRLQPIVGVRQPIFRKLLLQSDNKVR